MASSHAEVKHLVDMIASLVVGATKDPTDNRKQIFSECVHFAINNHFSGDDVLHYLGEGGWTGTMTCRCNHLPKSEPRKYFNFIKAAPVDARSKVARFKQPIIAGKNVKHQDSDRVTDKKEYVLCHVSFQSTGGTNISTINALLLVDLYVRDCSKGRGQQKRTWGVEMNEAQETYLKNTLRFTRLIRCSWDGISLTGHGGGGMHPPDMQKHCHEYGIFFVPSVCQRYCGSRMEGHSCIRTKVLAEDVSSHGTVQMFKLTLSRG